MGRENKAFRGLLLFLLIVTCVAPTPHQHQCFAETDEAVDARIEKLIAILKTGNGRARRAAAEALVEIGVPAIEPLNAALQDADKAFGKAITFVLEKIGSAPSWPPAKPRCTLRKDPEQEYFVYVPRDLDGEKTYRIFVVAHGLGGNGSGALGFTGFANEGNCIVVAPTFKGFYQIPATGAGKVMLEIIDEISEACKVYPKVFVTGFSAGAQFAHRFALGNPEHVVGCAAHSPGRWTTPNPGARDVPFLVTCGEADADRINIAKTFAGQLKDLDYRYAKAAWFPGVGHSLCGEAAQLTKEHYWIATTGMTPEERKKVEEDLDRANRLVSDGKYRDAFKVFRRIAAIKQKSALTERAVEGIKGIQDSALQRLAEIEEQSRSDFRKALEALDEMENELKGTSATKAISRVRGEIMKRPDVVAAYKDAKNAQKAQSLYEAAAKLLEKKRYSSALAKLRAAAELTGTPYGEKAAQKIKEIEADPTAMNAEAKAQCRKWLALARNFLANKMTKQARQNLQKIIDTYPDREEAETAREVLKEIE